MEIFKNEIGHRLASRLATPEDFPNMEELLVDLGGSSFLDRLNESSVREFCRWKYLQNPAGEAVVGIALDGNKIISLAAGVPKRVQVNCKRRLAFELGDFITDSAYRKRGLFSRLIELICDEAYRRGTTFAYVRPNENSFPILQSRLSFRESAQIAERRYFLPSQALERRIGIPGRLTTALGVDSMFRRFVLPSSTPRVRVVPAARFGSEVDELARTVEDGSQFCLVRDASYLNWRYAAGPTRYRIWLAYRDNKLAGYIVGLTSDTDSQGVLVELFCGNDDEEVAAALVRSSMQNLLDGGVRSISTWILPTQDQSAPARTLARAFPRKVNPSLHFMVRALQPSSDTLPTGGWRIAMGDFDGV